MSNPDHQNHSFSKLRELVERFKLLAGVSSLSVASAILALSYRRRTGSQGADPSLGLILIALTGALSFFLTGYRSKDGPEKRGQSSLKQIRTG